jgi:hypothetical protein
MRNWNAALAVIFVLSSFAARAQYTPTAGQNAPAAAYREERAKDTDHAATIVKTDQQQVTRDVHGNAQGNQYDLAVDGAFAGQTVLILDEVGNTLDNTRAALREKGLASVVYRGTMPDAKELRAALSKSCELWFLSTSERALSDEDIPVIKEFFDSGHGVYIWGDNDPLYVDANRLADALIPGLRMEGDLYGDTVVGVAQTDQHVGLRKGHLITTGLEHLYEGVTIATIQFTHGQGKNEHLYGPQGSKPDGSKDRSPSLPQGFTPILYGSAGNLVTVAYEANGKRLVVDGGFTRLAISWDDAGTARYVKNAAAWLVNSEKFGNTIARAQ